MDFELSRLPTLCGWAPLIQLGEGLNGKSWCFAKKREFCQQTKFKMQCQLFCSLYPTSLPCRYGFSSLHNHMSQFLEIDLSHISHIYVYIHIYVHIPPHTHTHTPYWFPFSGELWLIQLLMQEFCKTKNVCKSIGYMEFAINSIVYLKIVSYMPHILNMSNIYYKHIYICMHTLFSQRLRCSLFSSKPKIKVCISFLNQIVSVCEVCYKFRAVWFSCFLK